MKYILSFALMTTLLTTSCQNSNESNRYDSAINRLLDFFDKNAYDAELKTYLSEIDNSGQAISSKVYNVALSRLVYGLSYASSIDKAHLDRAEAVAKFQIANLTAEDSVGSYFRSYFDVQANESDGSDSFDVWQQAYGLCGLAELYRNNSSDDLLADIHRFHKGFVDRFYDSKKGGFYGSHSVQGGKNSGSKSIQSLMYPLTAYMENLWIADVANRAEYEPILKGNMEIAYQNVWDAKLGWVNIKFDDEWNPCEHPSSEEACSTVTPGHNFQFASLLLRTKNWDFLTTAEKEKYEALALEILDATLSKPIFSAEDLSQGFCSEVNPLTDEVIDDRKTWWQHCEALLALSLAGDRFEKELNELEQFYFSAFPDTENGGEFFFLDKDNTPDTEELKGSIGKSTYHTIEMIKFLNVRSQKN